MSEEDTNVNEEDKEPLELLLPPMPEDFTLNKETMAEMIHEMMRSSLCKASACGGMDCSTCLFDKGPPSERQERRERLNQYIQASLYGKDVTDVAKQMRANDVTWEDDDNGEDNTI